MATSILRFERKPPPEHRYPNQKAAQEKCCLLCHQADGSCASPDDARPERARPTPPRAPARRSEWVETDLAIVEPDLMLCRRCQERARARRWPQRPCAWPYVLRRHGAPVAAMVQTKVAASTMTPKTNARWRVIDSPQRKSATSATKRVAMALSAGSSSVAKPESDACPRYCQNRASSSQIHVDAVSRPPIR